MSITETGLPAVLFIVFARLDVTMRVFQAIRIAKPPKLYIAADGPRASKQGEAERVGSVRQYLLNAIDWPCEVFTLFREENVGCKRAVSGAIDWFFQHEEQGIILEDDCLPHPDFFPYCCQLLSFYANSQEVMAIQGCNFQNEVKRGTGSYYFSRYIQVWGWATWRRAWAHNDVALTFWPAWKQNFSSKVGSNYDAVEQKHWVKVFDRMHENLVDAWSYAWFASIMRANGKVIAPNVNLISNIGFGEEATHTVTFDKSIAERPVSGILPLVHPDADNTNVQADLLTFNHFYNGRNKRWPRRALFLHKDLKRWIKSYLK